MSLTLLIDAKNCLYRHNFTSNLTAPNGQKISGAFGMLKDVTNLVREYKPDQVIIAWDKGRSVKRIAILPEYKANRKKDDPAFLENVGFQVKAAKALFNCLPVIQISLPDTEADDIIGFFAKKLKGQKIIASSDTDFIQLINEDVKIVKSRKGAVKELTHENIQEELGFDQKHYVVHKSLTGDTSDNIPGVKGIGPKTATKIINKEVKKEIDKETLKRNISLIKICDVLTKEDCEKIVEKYKLEKQKRPNIIKLRSLLAKLRFNSLLTNFSGMFHCYKELEEKQRMKNG